MNNALGWEMVSSLQWKRRDGAMVVYDERAKLYRMAQMMEGMERHHFVKQIGN